jgi:catechol 2,3-dioxygenase-like lactoylglutathione lyase family enzyme
MHRGLINHLDVSVSDVNASTAFYDKILGRLGYTRSAEYAGEVPCWVHSTPGANFSMGLHQARVDTPHNRYASGLHHLAFHLSSRQDVDDFHAYLINEGIRILDAPAEYDYTPGYYAVFFGDPDGMKLELVYEPRFEPST